MRMTQFKTLFAALAVAVLSGCVTVTVPEDRDLAFAAAVEAFQNDDPETTAAAAWHYLQGATSEDPKYDRALRLMGRSSEALGLTYAASLWYLEVARARRDVELLPEVLRGLERLVMEGPHDSDTLVRGFLASADLTDLPSDVQAFVDYQQGLNSARKGLDDWADIRFSKIPATSPYRHRADYVKAVRFVATGKLEKAQLALETLLEKEDKLPADLKMEVYRSLARIHFENEAFEKAIERYEIIRQLAPDDPDLLLEMAWSYFHQGNTRRAMGLLLALDAPVYADFIAPERFLLEALSLQRLCQFEPARLAATRLQRKHGDAYTDLYRGVPLNQSPALRAGARKRSGARTEALFVDLVEKERKRAEALGYTVGPALGGYLKKLYNRGAAEAQRRQEEAIDGEVKILARDLLASEEGVRLILHELGVALLRGRRRPEEAAEEVAALTVPWGGDKAFYNFENEFWTDELDDFVVVVEDRCID
jgi:tetratricopeptide (TPR) repeat protein